MAMSLFRGLLVFLCLLQATDSVNNTLKASKGKRVELPCEYPFEEQGPIPELVLHWKSPNDTLLCAIVKQRSIHHCQPGYMFQYRPGKLALVIEKVRREDFGNHTCSAYKENVHSDYVTDISLEGRSLSPSGTTCCKPSCYALLTALLTIECITRQWNDCPACV